MGESAEGSAGQSDTSDVVPLIDGHGVNSRTIRPRFICQPFATRSGGGGSSVGTGNDTGTGTVPLNFFFAGHNRSGNGGREFSATLNGAFAPDGLTTTVYFRVWHDEQLRLYRRGPDSDRERLPNC